MQTKPLLKKCLVIGIMLLFIGTSISTTPAHNISMDTSVSKIVLTYRTGIWTEMQKLFASDGSSWDSFGMSVSFYGDTALIGAPYDGDNGYNSGSAYVFTRTGTTWTQQQKLLASDGAIGDLFGFSVSLSADTALIGAFGDDSSKGSAYVFTRTGTTWTQQQKLLASDGAAEDYFGYTLSHDDDTAIIGAPQDNNSGQYSGSAYVFTLNGTTWTQQAKLLASDGAPSDNFGCSISLNGDTALIGAMDDTDNGNFSGSAYVFTRTGTTWTQQAKLLASDGSVGDQFGVSVSLSGDTSLIGAYEDSDNGTASGSAYVFTRIGTTWAQQQKLLASDGEAYDKFGWSISLDSDTALIGAAGDDSLKGSAYVFTRTGTIWTQQQKLLASDGEADNYFGCSVSLSGDTALIGAFGGNNYKGSAYIFTNENENQPPAIPAPPTGPSQGQTGVEYTFSAMTTDPDGDAISYLFDWGDGENSSWVGPFPSGTTATATHTWSAEGTYLVKVKARDENGAETDWSPSHSISITAAPNLTIEQFKGGLGISAVVKNIGDATATNITWSINLDGKLIFLGKSSTGTIATIAAAGEKPIKSKLIFGFGQTNIVVSATCDEGVSADVNKTGFILGPFIFGVK